MSLIDEDYISDIYEDDENYIKFENRKARFNTKFADSMKHNGEIVEVLGLLEGRDIYNDRYIVRFNDNTIENDIYSNELDFDAIQTKKQRTSKAKER